MRVFNNFSIVSEDGMPRLKARYLDDRGNRMQIYDVCILLPPMQAKKVEQLISDIIDHNGTPENQKKIDSKGNVIPYRYR